MEKTISSNWERNPLPLFKTKAVALLGNAYSLAGCVSHLLHLLQLVAVSRLLVFLFDRGVCDRASGHLLNVLPCTNARLCTDKA